MTCTYAPERASSHAKSELFCRTCDHASPADSDWIRDDGVAGLRLRCPRCGNVVVSRPAL